MFEQSSVWGKCGFMLNHNIFTSVMVEMLRRNTMICFFGQFIVKDKMVLILQRYLNTSAADSNFTPSSKINVLLNYTTQIMRSSSSLNARETVN